MNGAVFLLPLAALVLAAFARPALARAARQARRRGFGRLFG